MYRQIISTRTHLCHIVPAGDMAESRFRRRSSWVWVTVMTLVVATKLLLVKGEPPDGLAKGSLRRSSWSSFNNRNTLQKQRGNTNVAPHVVPQNERNFKDGPPWEPGKKNFESTTDVVAGDLKNQDAQQALKNEHTHQEKLLNVRVKRQIDMGTSVHSTPISQATTASSVSEEDTPRDNSVTPNITSPFEPEQNDSNYDYNDYHDYIYHDYHDANNTHTLKLLAFTRRLFLCEYVYSAIYKEYTNFTEAGVSYGNTSLSLVTDETFMNICLPLLRMYNGSCHEKDSITICDSEDIAFLHPQDCQEPSSDDLYFQQLLFATLVEEDDVCFQAVCEGSLRVVEREVEGVLVRLISPNTTSCHKYLQEYYQEQLNETMVLHRTRNRYWPCCFPGYDVLWIGEPESLAAVVKDWSYLPSHCRFGEGFLVLMVMCVVMGGMLGNLLLVTVLMRRDHHGTPTTIINISFALASLLLSCVVLAPSLYNHLSLINSDYSLQTPSTDVDEVDDGFQVFSAVVMSLCSIITLVNMFALSLERFLLAIEFVQWKNVITRPRVKGFVIVSWTLSLLVSLVLGANWDGRFVILRYSFDKLPFGVSPEGTEIKLPAVTVSMGILFLLTGVLSVQYVRNYRKKRERIAAELDNLGELSSDQSGDQSHHVTVTMIFMAISSIYSALMGGLACLLHLSALRFAHVELVRYLCWWVFLGASTWNSWLFVLPSQEFRSDAAAVLKMLVPSRIWDKAIRWYHCTPRGANVQLVHRRREIVRRKRHLPGTRYNVC